MTGVDFTLPGQVLETRATSSSSTSSRSQRSTIDLFASVYSNLKIPIASLVAVLSTNNNPYITFKSCDFSNRKVVDSFKRGLELSANKPRKLMFIDCDISREKQLTLSRCIEELGIEVSFEYGGCIDTPPSAQSLEPIEERPTWFLDLIRETELLRRAGVEDSTVEWDVPDLSEHGPIDTPNNTDSGRPLFRQR